MTYFLEFLLAPFFELNIVISTLPITIGAGVLEPFYYFLFFTFFALNIREIASPGGRVPVCIRWNRKYRKVFASD